MTPWFILWAAYRWTGDKKYLVPFGDNRSGFAAADQLPTRSTC